MENEQTERAIIELIATDRIDIPISSMSGKLKRAKPKLAQAVDLAEYGGLFVGDRAYAKVEYENVEKARTMREGVEVFKDKYPQYGRILEGIIAEKRVERETHLYFGLNENSRLTANDYLGVMTSLGFTEAAARSFYPELLDASRRISRAREEDKRSVMIG